MGLHTKGSGHGADKLLQARTVEGRLGPENQPIHPNGSIALHGCQVDIIAGRGDADFELAFDLDLHDAPMRRDVLRDMSAQRFIFNQELATLLRAGLPLVQSLEILRRRVPNPIFKVALDDVY